MNKKRVPGFTLIEIMVVVAIIGLLASIAVPNFLRAIEDSRHRACVANLQAIEGAKLQWMLAQHKSATDTPVDSDLFGSAGFIRDKPACRSGGSYTLNAVETRAVCSVAAHTY